MDGPLHIWRKSFFDSCQDEHYKKNKTIFLESCCHEFFLFIKKKSQLHVSIFFNVLKVDHSYHFRWLKAVPRSTHPPTSTNLPYKKKYLQWSPKWVISRKAIKVVKLESLICSYLVRHVRLFVWLFVYICEQWIFDVSPHRVPTFSPEIPLPPSPIDFGSNKPSFMSASMINDRGGRSKSGARKCDSPAVPVAWLQAHPEQMKSTSSQTGATAAEGETTVSWVLKKWT